MDFPVLSASPAAAVFTKHAAQERSRNSPFLQILAPEKTLRSLGFLDASH